MHPYVLVIKQPEDLDKEFKKVGVDRGGIKIMRPKGFSRIIKIGGIPSFLANILKQEMLSLGGDVALSRGSITGSDKKSDCLLMGSVAQIRQLGERVKRQPWGLSEIGQEFKTVLGNFDRSRTVLDLNGKRLHLGRRTLVMGIINITPDSFSSDGILGMDLEKAVSFAQEMVKEGADILDIGGESSRPGARRVSAREERKRVLPLLGRLVKSIRVPISIDTTKSEVARAALDAGASIINDISALRFDKKMARLAGKQGVSVILMHMKGTPRTMQRDPKYNDIMDEIFGFLADSIKRAKDKGVGEEKIIVDPGIGFGKTTEHNIEIIQRLSSLKGLGRPILIGLSRKSFIGRILNVGPSERIWGTAAGISMAIANGADIVRVHDVREMKQAVRLCDAIGKRRG